MKNHLALCALVLACASTAAPAADPPSNARPPQDEESLRRWLENMVWHHRFTDEEITAATGLTADEIAAARKRWNITPENVPDLPTDRLFVLPYPGGRHPRIGFLDGAVDPQRETKVSVFTPWHNPRADRADYVVVDVPEAIWSNLGLTYLAHTHVPTIWTRQGVRLDPLEWTSEEDGRLVIERRLPNGIEFRSTVMPREDHVRMSMTLTNGTDEVLTDLRVQNCVMLKGAAGFTEQTNDFNVERSPYVGRSDPSGHRWIITAWKPAYRAWGNAKCPCLHSDPKFDDCPPGETRRIDGWLSFYEGDDIRAEFDRIEATRWWDERDHKGRVEFGLVSGTVPLDGEPLTEGVILFHLTDRQFFGGHLDENGKYAIDRLESAKE